MRARDLVDDYPTVTVDTPAVEAARMIGSRHRPALVVLDERGRPLTVLPGSQVLAILVPGYVQEDPSLVGVFDEATADEMLRRLEGKTVGQLLPHPEKRQELPAVDDDANVLECAAVMARLHSPLLVVRQGDRILGMVTASRLLDALFG